MTRMELYERIRRGYFLEDKSFRALACEHGVHRRDVRRAVAGEAPPQRGAVSRQRPKLGAYVDLIDAWLKADASAPRKQRHTSRRMWLLLQEKGYEGAESTVRRYVGRRRRELGFGRREVYIEQRYLPGGDAQVDFGEAIVKLGGVETKVHLLFVRCCFSGRTEVVAFRQQTQQCLLEGLCTALARFGGVFERLWFDNLKPAVRRVLRGRRREQTDRFVAFRSHYLVEAKFCRPGLEGAHEKGGVEGEVGRFRRNHLVPVPSAETIEELNANLAACCIQDEQRRRAGHQETVGEQWAVSRAALRPLPAEPFDTTECAWPRVDRKSRVQVRRNFYSVPAALVGHQVQAVVSGNQIELWHRGNVVARHERLQGTMQESLVLDHYLEWFLRKPGAMPGSKVVHMARTTGSFPECYDRLWKALKDVHDTAEGTREFVRVLMLLRTAPPDEVTMSVELAMSYGCRDAGAVENVLRQLTRSNPLDCAPLVDIGHLAAFDRPLPDLVRYDAWLNRGGRDG